jgi:hypothetical protein
MIMTSRTFTRPSISVPWHTEQIADSLLFKSRLNLDFEDTGKILSRDADISIDGLIMTVTILWDSVESMNSHFDDPRNAQYFADRIEYNNSANIVMSELTISES